MAYYFRIRNSIINVWLVSKYTSVACKEYKEEIILHEKLYGFFLWVGFNCLKATKPLRGDSLLFTSQSPGVPGTHLIDFRRMEGCGLPWSHPVVLDWETSTLTIMIIGKRYGKCKCSKKVPFYVLQ